MGGKAEDEDDSHAELLSGKKKSIDPFGLSYILGKEETLKRLGCLGK